MCLHSLSISIDWIYTIQSESKEKFKYSRISMTESINGKRFGLEEVHLEEPNAELICMPDFFCLSKSIWIIETKEGNDSSYIDI